MSGVRAKKGASQRRSASEVLQTPRNAAALRVIDQAVQLGNSGYFLIKVASAASAAGTTSSDPASGRESTGNAARVLLDTSVPEIPAETVTAVLSRYHASQIPSDYIVKPAVAPGRQTAKASAKTPPENRAFMAELAKKEMSRRAERIAEGTLVTATELQERLAISRQAISRAVAAGRMFALDGPKGNKVFPAFYADPSLDRRVLERVTKVLGELPGPTKWQFFTTGKHSLGGKSPLLALAAGEVTSVLAAAKAFASR